MHTDSETAETFAYFDSNATAKKGKDEEEILSTNAQQWSRIRWTDNRISILNFLLLIRVNSCAFVDKNLLCVFLRFFAPLRSPLSSDASKLLKLPDRTASLYT